MALLDIIQISCPLWLLLLVTALEIIFSIGILFSLQNKSTWFILIMFILCSTILNLLEYYSDQQTLWIIAPILNVVFITFFTKVLIKMNKLKPWR